ncbi:centrosomal protein of 120 kDa isoform X4 [Dunckerocampus dactyliophorus]|uniref:centrosomal protein of 120 kDa isoform X4 n=1 Tax=Dunckerocampus dactyliophorus TaxID=161453 RepID=UPI00240763DE|nr:centrosomal protein of 120 kDa isoform X4 [Dunckerocampus dactyliophorus]
MRNARHATQGARHSLELERDAHENVGVTKRSDTPWSLTNFLVAWLASWLSRDFPKCSQLSLEVQASFDGEQLTTDPVDHLDQPQFSTELAWELDRKMLHQHRLQRTPIKLHCFAVDSSKGSRESVGYIVLDLRSVQEVPQEPRWYPLLSSKYTKKKPSLLLSMVLENDGGSSPLTSPKPKKDPPRQEPPAAHHGDHPPAARQLMDKLEVVLVPEKGYHQVGAADAAADMFVLSVTVAFASKLEQLIPSTMKLSAEGSSFFFFYTLLGNDITSEPFQNLLAPDFQPERASVRIRSSERVLRRFLSQQPSLQIHLCCGTHSLGSADVPLATLAALATDLARRAATVEGVFALHPPALIRHTLPPQPTDLRPNVSVAVTLRQEDVPPALQPLANEDASKTIPAPPLPGLVMAPPAEEQVATSTPVRNAPGASPSPPPAHPSSCVDKEAEHRQEAKDTTARPADNMATPAPSQPETEGGAPKVSIPPSAHHYCFSLDLCSLSDLGLSHPIAATLRYLYPFFGSTSPVMTSHPVELHRNTKVSLPHSYCSFNFATVPQQLHNTFLRVALVLELWHKDASSRDHLIGRASLQLSSLLAAERTRHLADTGETGWRQTHQDRVPFFSTQSQKVAELNYVATLDDFGLVNVQHIPVSQSTKSEPAVPLQTSTPPVAAPPLLPPGPRDTLEYHKALELELWKEKQEDDFNDQLRRKERIHMQALAEEWMRREREREALVNRKVSCCYQSSCTAVLPVLEYQEMECSRLEEQLQTTLADLEKKDKHLTEATLKTQRLQRDLLAEHNLNQKELQEKSRRLQLECDHRVALERDKVRLMEEEHTRLLKQLSDAESRYKQVEKDFHVYKEQQNVRPEVRLQSEINILTLEKVELERKLESTTKSKLHYKQQWGRALKELARFKQREQENAMTRLKKQQAELDAMRLRYLATEEKEAVRQDRQELGDIRNQVNRFKQQQQQQGDGPVEPAPILSDSADEHLSRLLEERDTLLRTGVYTHEDRIISELNRQIQDAMAGRTTANPP